MCGFIKGGMCGCAKCVPNFWSTHSLVNLLDGLVTNSANSREMQIAQQKNFSETWVLQN